MQANKYGIIVDDIISKIRHGKLKVGHKIVSREELAISYNVSPSTVTKALNHLEDMGYIRKLERIGSFVTDKINEKRNLLVSIPYSISGLANQKNAVSSLPLLLHYVESLADANNFKIHIVVNDFMAEEEIANAVRDLNCKIDAAILISSDWYRTEWFHDVLLKGNIPHVFVEQYQYNADFVASNNVNTIYNITKEFINMGYKRFVYISAPIKFSSARIDRMEGFMTAIGESSVMGEIWSVTNIDNIKDLANKLASENADNTAIISFVPYLMRRLWLELKTLGFNTSQLSWGTIDSSEIIYSNNTTIIEAVQPAKEIIERVFEIVEERLSGVEGLRQEFFETSLKVTK